MKTKNMIGFVLGRNAFTVLAILVIHLVGPYMADAQDSRKKALLIGIGQYPEAGGWNALSSANDLSIIQKTLLIQGFSEQYITVLSDGSATKENILKTLQKDLYQQLQPGDIFYFHFSGHGQQMEDKTGDEQIDHLDECIVPFDSPKKFQEGIYEGDRLITDDELGQSLAMIRKKLGPEGHVVVVLDACHSGTGTRGFSQARGTTEVMASPEFLKNLNRISSSRKENNELPSAPRGADETQMAPMISFFGAAQNQLNYETTTDQGEQVGSLSYAFSKCLSNFAKGVSYRGLFDRLRNQMAVTSPLQQPQVEGELDMDVFNGKLLGKVSYFRVINVISDTLCKINGGSLQGIEKGAVLGFYKAETRDFENAIPITKGLVQKSLMLNASVLLDTPVPENVLKESWVYVLETGLGDIRAKVSLDLLTIQLKTQLSGVLQQKPYIELTDTVSSQLILSHQVNDTQKLFLMVKGGYCLDSFQLSQHGQLLQVHLLRLQKLIRKFIQGSFYRKLDVQSVEIKVSFKIIPQDSIKEGDPLDATKPLGVDETSVKQLPEDSEIRILIQNEGIKPAFFCLMDIQPDNIINVLLPDQSTAAEELRILPGQKLLISTVFKIGPPYGTEVFKLVASAKPMDLKSTIGTRGSGPQNPFQQLYQTLDSEDEMQTRGGKAVSLPGSEIHVYSDTFIITK